MGDVLLQDLWFHQVEGVMIENAVVDGELVVVRARASAERAALKVHPGLPKIALRPTTTPYLPTRPSPAPAHLCGDVSAREHT
ncbi:hypothetical protein [Streptomyces sp. NPDC050121]|uniref:hypothetical protein n=1 Tax=Streptomyces sp. NPDC050121 TaxID=3365601 RepID=UPI0037B0B8A2